MDFFNTFPTKSFALNSIQSLVLRDQRTMLYCCSRRKSRHGGVNAWGPEKIGAETVATRLLPAFIISNSVLWGDRGQGYGGVGMIADVMSFPYNASGNFRVFFHMLT